jgi:hypothetical protein
VELCSYKFYEILLLRSFVERDTEGSIYKYISLLINKGTRPKFDLSAHGNEPSGSIKHGEFFD